tara:strand:- start:2328 stop:2513 length:186 start_codon:yes stop_codon:yes gene_type:complete
MDKMKEKIMEHWENLFKILQVLNPESDKYIKPYYTIDEEESTERWEDICYYMDLLKPEEEK